MARYEVIAFETEPGKAPFQDWYDGIKDAKAKTIILARIGRAAEEFRRLKGDHRRQRPL
jgi:hypothetical protein